MALDKNDPVGIYKLKNINFINRVGDSSHDIFPKVQGKGYGYSVLQAGVDAVFEMIGLHRLNTEVLENNIASQKTAIKAGFTIEGIKKQSVYRCGEWLNSITYGLTYPDWKNLDRIKKMKGCCNLSYIPKNNLSNT